MTGLMGERRLQLWLSGRPLHKNAPQAEKTEGPASLRRKNEREA